jgi:hypothetical protein
MVSLSLPWGTSRLAGVAVALIASAIPPNTVGAQEDPSFTVHPLGYIRVDDAETAAHLRHAILGALEWVRRSECRAVLSDFHDPSGRSISEVLSRRGQSLEEHIQTLFFEDGRHLRGCRRRQWYAATSPGSHFIYVCPAKFHELLGRPLQTRAVVLHEVLHSLGVGEDPPSSYEITKGVLARCVE